MDVKDRLLADLRRRGYLADGAGAGCGIAVTRWGEPAWRAVPAAGEAGAPQALMDATVRQRRLVEVGHVGIMSGETYGGAGYLRMCLACPRSKVERGMERMLRGIRS